MADEHILVHVTHEAAGKIGGIGAVLQGFFTCPTYLEAVGRSILVSPLFTTEGSLADRLGEGGEVLYSSIDGLINPGYSSAFRRIESLYNVGIVYGRRTFTDGQAGTRSAQEVILIDVRYMDAGPLNEFKRQLFEEFGVRSDLHEHLWEYEQYVRLGPPAIAVLKALGAAEGRTTMISHEFMGMPTVLAAKLEPYGNFRTVFYAHEVATVRRIVEERPGHDTMFYNVMQQAYKDRLYVDDVFGDQNSYFKHSLVEASKYCDRIYAVGDLVADELRFLAPEFATLEINVVYNGIPAYDISASEKREAKEKLRSYCRNVLGYKPDHIFTHVTRLVRSKGLWRDLHVLSEMDKMLTAKGETAVYLLLSTEVCRRRTSDIHTVVQRFNARSRSIKAVFINQFGFDARSCGHQMPADMEFVDIRIGTDVEFGQSIYEPFGIAQLEPLTFGGICVVSNVCGCVGFLQDVTGGQPTRNVVVASYTDLGDYPYADIEDLQQIDQAVRDRIEEAEAAKLAVEIVKRLPKDEVQVEELVREGYRLASNMSWDVVVRKFFLHDLDNVQGRQVGYSDFLRA
jgi:hypothetical protein